MISPYDELIQEWRAQETRDASQVWLSCARQLEAIAACDNEHAAIWRRRWELATGAAEPANLRELDDPELALQYAELQSHRQAIRRREDLLEAQLIACENELNRRETP